MWRSVLLRGQAEMRERIAAEKVTNRLSKAAAKSVQRRKIAQQAMGARKLPLQTNERKQQRGKRQRRKYISYCRIHGGIPRYRLPCGDLICRRCNADACKQWYLKHKPEHNAAKRVLRQSSLPNPAPSPDSPKNPDFQEL